MKINWFGKTYYGNHKEYTRPVWVAFKMLITAVVWKMLGKHWNGSEQEIHKFCYKKHWVGDDGILRSTKKFGVLDK